jgi:ribosomal protein S18 acetylase RimI-like enzyme
MTIEEIKTDKKRFLQLLLLGDEQEEMIDRYLDHSRMFLLKEEEEAIGECVVQDLGGGLLEIKNLAIIPECQGRGFGRMLIEFVEGCYKPTHTLLQVGTGDSPLTIPFYEKCGFVRSHVMKDFFIENYDHPIFECGVHLIDMVYLQKRLNATITLPKVGA